MIKEMLNFQKQNYDPTKIFFANIYNIHSWCITNLLIYNNGYLVLGNALICLTNIINVQQVYHS